MPPKRACDSCISRKVKCSGSWPCDTCRTAVKWVRCTYLRPAGRRGPKARKPANSNVEAQSAVPEDQPELEISTIAEEQTERYCFSRDLPSLQRIPKSILATVINIYQQCSYSVWPVIHAKSLLERVENIKPEAIGEQDEITVCLATALCAATMAQLQMSPMMDGDGYGDGSQRIDATTMVHTCLQMRRKYDSNGENLCLRSILISFFLHVYHAKVNQRNSAMMFIQEAIAGSRILRLNEGLPQPKDGLIANQDLVFPLLWVSERGYSLHLGLSPSYTEPPTILGIESSIEADVHAQGLLELVRLFVAFDKISMRRRPHGGTIAVTDLTETEKRLSSLSFSMADHISTRSADYHVTREWMRTIIWQEALAMGLLSSAAYTSVMTFGFPAQVGRDLLQALRGFRVADLLPLGRDQLLKCFEVANSLADTVLLRSTLMSSRRELGPQDFLHALYQKIVPFLEQDRMLLGILRAKTAEALVTAPARLLTMNERSPGLYGVETETDQRTHLGGYLSYVAEQSDLETNSLNFSQQGLQMI